jgi:cell division protease FtsH
MSQHKSIDRAFGAQEPYMTLKTTDPERPVKAGSAGPPSRAGGPGVPPRGSANKPKGAGKPTGSGSATSGQGGEGPSPPRLWMVLLILMFLVGLPRLMALNENRVSFDQFVQLVEQGQLRHVSFQVDTIVGESSVDEDSATKPAAHPSSSTAATTAKAGTESAAPASSPAASTANAATPAPATSMTNAATQAPPATSTATSAPAASAATTTTPATSATAAAAATPATGTAAAKPADGHALAGLAVPKKIYRTGRLESAERDLILKLNEKKIPYDAVSTPSLLVTIGSWVLPMVMLFFFGSWLMRRSGGLGGIGGSVFNFGKNKAQMYTDTGSGVTFSDVAGQREAKAELVEIIDFLRSPERYTRLGGHIPRGVLLVGPPGTGKTLLARAVAGEAAVPFFSISGSEFVEMFVGVGAARVRDLFTQAKEKAPCIIFIDELDAIGRARGVAGPVVAHEEREQTLDQLLTEMDGFDGTTGVIIMAATNRPEILDPALLRAGRFDRRVVVDRPSLEDRLEILQVHSRKVILEKGVRLDAIAAMTAGLVGADLANLVNEAALLAARRQADAVAEHDFQEALERIVAGLERKSRRLSAKDKQQVAYHECGHALVATLLPGADAVKKISIVPRGIGALGYTMQTPNTEEGDRYLLTRGELYDRVTVLLGGRAAEEEMLADISTGAQDDLQRATALVRRMVLELGMSRTLGLQAFDSGRGQFLDVASGLGGIREVSDETARAIDQEVRGVLDERYAEARRLVREHRDAMQIAAQELLKEEILDGQRFRALIEAKPAAAPPTTPPPPTA